MKVSKTMRKKTEMSMEEIQEIVNKLVALIEKQYMGYGYWKITEAVIYSVAMENDISLPVERITKIIILKVKQQIRSNAGVHGVGIKDS